MLISGPDAGHVCNILCIGNFMIGFIYAIAIGSDRVKIGWSTNPRQRLGKLRTDCPEPAVLLGAIEGTKEQERALHERLASCHISREWFHRGVAVENFLSSLPKFPPIKIEEPTSAIAQRRLELGLTQVALGRCLGVDGMTISRWERGETLPQKRHWPKIKEVTGLSFRDLVAANCEAA